MVLRRTAWWVERLAVHFEDADCPLGGDDPSSSARRAPAEARGEKKVASMGLSSTSADNRDSGDPSWALKVWRDDGVYVSVVGDD